MAIFQLSSAASLNLGPSQNGVLGYGLSDILDLSNIMLCVNSLPDNKILDRSKLKAFADDNLNANQKLKFASGRTENIV